MKTNFKFLIFAFLGMLSFSQHALSNTILNAKDTTLQVLTCHDSTEIKLLEKYPGLCAGTPTISASSKAGATLSYTGNSIIYQYAQTGHDTVSYNVVCGDTTLLGKIFITVVECPDNISTVDCFGDPSSFDWAIREAWVSKEDNICTYQTPLIGDLDGDGIPEIVIPRFLRSGASPDLRQFQGIYVYWGTDRDNPTLIPTVKGGFQGQGIAMAKAKIGGTVQPFIVMVGLEGADAGRLIAYTSDRTKTTEPTARLWTSDAALRAYSPNDIYTLSIADFNGDGNPEIYVGNQIFDAASGHLLLNPGSAGYSYGRSDWEGYFSCNSIAADVDNDGIPELIAGTKVYKVNINNTNGTAGNSLTLFSSIPDINLGNGRTVSDGWTTVADINEDGYLDVVFLSSLHHYSPGNVAGDSVLVAVWDVKNQELLGKTVTHSHYGDFGVPFIANLDDDPGLEITFTTTINYDATGSQPAGRVESYRWDGTQTLQRVYMTETTDHSGTTGITAFDFNLDHKAELVYRDEGYLRIMEARNGDFTNLETFPVYSNTGFEMAVVADADADGAAEIIVIGGDNPNTPTNRVYMGRLRIYKSGNQYPWAPARKVWNQYMYNVVNINEDLTVPQFQMNPATFFPNGKQPFNNFLQQQTLLNQNGDPFLLLPDIVWEGTPTATLSGDSVTFAGCITNTGAAALQGPIYVTFYKNDTLPGNIIAMDSIPMAVKAGDTGCLSLAVHNIRSYQPFSSIWISVNDRNGAYPYQRQCEVNGRFELSVIGAVDDTISTKPAVPVTVPVLGNDMLIPGGSVTVVIHGNAGEIPADTLQAPKYGTAKVVSGNQIEYTPDAGFEGIDEFEYEIWYPNPADSGNPAKGLRSRAKVYVLVIDPDRITCSDSETITLLVPDGVTGFDLYTAATGGGSLSTGRNPKDPLTVSRNSQYHTYCWLGIDYTKTDGTPVFPDRIPVSFRFVPHEMHWLGINNDWNDPVNWSDSEGGQALNPDLKFVPWGCTIVYIPEGANTYPSLNESTFAVYNGRPDNEPVCDEIYFAHGGEVVRTDLLHYNKAHVELTLEAERWNMLSAPLRYMYPGDYYQNNPCPHADSLRIYQQLFAMNNPQTGAADTSPTGGWTLPFNNPEVPMPAGFGYAIQLIDSGKILLGNGKTAPISNESDWTPLPAGQRHSIWLPKNDASYNIYVISSNGGSGNPPYTASCDAYDTRPLERNNPLNYRFIYEGDNNWETGSWTGDITLTTSGATDAGKQVIVGNPFMAHWSFDDFYAQDSTLITKEYKVLESANDAAFTTCSPSLTSWDSDEKIAPMQSVLVTSKTAFGATALKTRVTATEQNPGVILKSSTSNPNLLKIVATKDGKQNQSYVLYDASASNNYLLEEDSYKLFVTDVTDPVSVYTRSADNYALDINLWGDCSQMIPLGIRTSQTGTVNLQFEGAENFDGALLFDNLMDATVNLKETPSYSFEKTTSDLFVDGRFYLSINKAPNSDLFPRQETISIFTTGNRIQIVSSNEDINEVQVFDMQGRLLHKAANIGSLVYSQDLERNMIYIVKVLTNGGMAVRKVITGN